MNRNRPQRASFAQIVTHAQARTNMYGAEFDYNLFAYGQTSLAALADATYELANSHLPAVDTSTTDDDLRQRRANADALMNATRDERDAMVAAAKQKTYTGWSTASRGPIRYAR
jgi:hypothetical protein